MSFTVGEKRRSEYRLAPPPPKRPRIIEPQKFVGLEISRLKNLVLSSNIPLDERILNKAAEVLGVEKKAAASTVFEWCVKGDKLDRAFELIDSCGFPSGETMEEVKRKIYSPINGIDLDQRVGALVDLILSHRKLDKFQEVVHNRLQSPSVTYFSKKIFGEEKHTHFAEFLDYTLISSKKYVEAFLFLKDPEVVLLCHHENWCRLIKNLMESMIEDREEITNPAFDQLPTVLQDEQVDFKFLQVVLHTLDELGKTTITFRIVLGILCTPEKQNFLDLDNIEDYIASSIVTEDDCELAIKFAFKPSTPESIKTLLIDAIDKSKFNYSKYTPHDPKKSSENQSDLVALPLSFDELPQQKRKFIGDCMTNGLSSMFPPSTQPTLSQD